MNSISKELSELSTGMVLIKTKVSTDKRQGVIETTDENGMVVSNPDWTTYIMTEAEKLNVTDWNAQLGTAILGSAIAHIELIESI
tara:strand:- start:1491 stop:1745 length:255 start_codon:yes stop_codon:yes gene_type:complete